MQCETYTDVCRKKARGYVDDPMRPEVNADGTTNVVLLCDEHLEGALAREVV